MTYFVSLLYFLCLLGELGLFEAISESFSFTDFSLYRYIIPDI